jgi:hypothetical protein
MISQEQQPGGMIGTSCPEDKHQCVELMISFDLLHCRVRCRSRSNVYNICFIICVVLEVTALEYYTIAAEFGDQIVSMI